LGFFTGASDGMVFYWRLEDSSNKIMVFNQPGIGIESICLAVQE